MAKVISELEGLINVLAHVYNTLSGHDEGDRSARAARLLIETELISRGILPERVVGEEYDAYTLLNIRSKDWV